MWLKEMVSVIPFICTVTSSGGWPYNGDTGILVVSHDDIVCDDALCSNLILFGPRDERKPSFEISNTEKRTAWWLYRWKGWLKPSLSTTSLPIELSIGSWWSEMVLCVQLYRADCQGTALVLHGREGYIVGLHMKWGSCGRYILRPFIGSLSEPIFHNWDNRGLFQPRRTFAHCMRVGSKRLSWHIVTTREEWKFKNGQFTAKQLRY